MRKRRGTGRQGSANDGVHHPRRRRGRGGRGVPVAEEEGRSGDNMSTELKWSDRDEIREFHDCPRCGAKAGVPCRGVRGKPRVSNHAERAAEYKAEIASIKAFFREGSERRRRSPVPWGNSGSRADRRLPWMHGNEGRDRHVSRRPCITCGRLVSSGSYCTGHAPRRANRQTPGRGGRWRASGEVPGRGAALRRLHLPAMRMRTPACKRTTSGRWSKAARMTRRMGSPYAAAATRRSSGSLPSTRRAPRLGTVIRQMT